MSKRKVFPAAALSVAACFLFNPNVSTVDVLPDFIGYLFILYALRHLVSFVPYMAAAADAFRKLFYITLLKLPALFLMLTLASERVTITLFSLVFAILELVFLYPAFQNLFEGLFYLGERFDCPAALRAERLRGGVDSIRTMTFLFITAKAVLSTLPDFAFLPSYDPLTGKGFTVTTTQYVFLLSIAFVLCLILGIVWLGYTLPYFNSLARDKGVKDLVSPYCEDLPQRESRRLRLSLPFFLFAAAVVFSVDLVFDNTPVPPTYLGAGLFLALAVLLFFTTEKRRIPMLSVTASYFVTTILFTHFRSRFFATFTLADLTRFPMGYYQNPEAAAAYLPVLLLSALSELLFLACFILLGLALIDLGQKGKPTLSPDTYEGRQQAREGQEERKKNVLCLVFAVLSALTSFAYTLLSQYNERVDMQPGYGGTAFYIPLFAGFWILPLVFSAALAVDTVLLASARTKRLWREHEATPPDYDV
ncbi:MAG: hypothetical protein IJF73_00300 [Clostridia bacterium]|nr:hypothetical protein [Clostridia bacterium]